MELLSVSEAARRVGCSRTTIYRAVEDGRLNAKHTGSNTVILADKKWEEFEPEVKGGRARKLKEQDDESTE